MKWIISIFSIAIYIAPASGQEEKQSSENWSLSVSGHVSSFAADFSYEAVFDDEVITRGISIRPERQLNEKFYFSSGIIYRTTGMNRQTGFINPGMLASDAYVGPFKEEWQDWYFDLPVNIGHSTRISNRFQLKYDIGVRINYAYYKYWTDHSWYTKSHEELSFQGGSWSMGAEFNVRQSFALIKGLDLLVSEGAGYYLAGDLTGLSSVEIGLGVSYRF